MGDDDQKVKSALKRLATVRDFELLAEYKDISGANSVFFQALLSHVKSNKQTLQPYREYINRLLEGVDFEKLELLEIMQAVTEEHQAYNKSSVGGAAALIKLLDKSTPLDENDRNVFKESVILSVDTCQCFSKGGQALSCACAGEEGMYEDQKDLLTKVLTTSLEISAQGAELPEFPTFIQSTEIHQNLTYFTSAEDFELIEAAINQNSTKEALKAPLTMEQLKEILKGVGPIQYQLPGTENIITLTDEDILLYVNNREELSEFYLGVKADGTPSDKYHRKVKVSATTGKITDEEIPEAFKKLGVTLENSGGMTWGNHCVGVETNCNDYIIRSVNENHEDILTIDVSTLTKDFGTLTDDQKKVFIKNFCANFGLVLKGGIGPHPYAMVAEGDEYHSVLRVDPRVFGVQSGKVVIRLAEVRAKQTEFAQQQNGNSQAYPVVSGANFRLTSMKQILEKKETAVVTGAATDGYCATTTTAQLLKFKNLAVSMYREMTSGIFELHPKSDAAIFAQLKGKFMKMDHKVNAENIRQYLTEIIAVKKDDTLPLVSATSDTRGSKSFIDKWFNKDDSFHNASKDIKGVVAAKEKDTFYVTSTEDPSVNIGKISKDASGRPTAQHLTDSEFAVTAAAYCQILLKMPEFKTGEIKLDFGKADFDKTVTFATEIVSYLQGVGREANITDAAISAAVDEKRNPDQSSVFKATM